MACPSVTGTACSFTPLYVPPSTRPTHVTIQTSAFLPVHSTVKSPNSTALRCLVNSRASFSPAVFILADACLAGLFKPFSASFSTLNKVVRPQLPDSSAQAPRATCLPINLSDIPLEEEG
ncbi:unnamed protein product [Mesocestoides corti]|uniref:Ig-like domain-containing protein n=1 Tax=Mesocestoides corti TaxID=53468 RepID=A0A0R3U5A3_MESCO|nr:unnamed protein product [Mesocestoides corti]